MDFETMCNLFVAVFVHYKTDEKKVFVIHHERDDTVEFLEFLDHNRRFHEWHISFNGLHFDSQITEAILRNKNFINMSTEDRVSFIYQTSQNIINRVEKWPEYPEWKLSIKQIDVFKINHWDNVNKKSSLKWIQCMIDWHNVQEMPIHHTQYVTELEDIVMIIDYCTNDVLSTKKVYQLSQPLLEVRLSVQKKYNLPCINYSNTKLGSELLLKLYCELTGKEKKIVKEYRTNRPAIPVGPIIFPYVEFKTPELQGFLHMMKQQVITTTKHGFEYTLKYKGYEFFIGAGGIHQCIKSGIYKAEGDDIIDDADVGSLYPNLGCQNGMFPAHLGPEFFHVYKGEIVDVRMAEKAKPKAERDMAIIEGFKEAANASYGNSNQIHSWLYDPQYTMQTTINGQLSILMLVEELLTRIPGALLLQTNTDGLTLKYNKKYKPVYEEISKEWEKKTKLTLEFASYEAMYIWDVNNYIALKSKTDAKCKGRFEWEEFVKYKYTHLHKNKSYLIVAKAIFAFFVHNIMPEDYLKSNRNIFDYCAFAKLKGNWIFKQTCIIAGEVFRETLQKTLRYYVSTDGCKITKKNVDDGREIQLEAGKWVVTDYCKAVERPWQEYHVDEKFYLEQIYAEIERLVPKKSPQLKLEL
jgi:hypothetical protein